MIQLQLKTVALLSDGCFSVLLWEGRPFAVSVERTFDSGQPIIQAGMYQCNKSHFNRGGYDTFEIEVPGHDRILFHRGNTEDDSIGCVCIAEKFGILNNETAVLDSVEGFADFMAKTAGLDSFNMEVTGR